MNPASSWLALEPQAIAWREWDGEAVVYNDTTGSTHHLSALGACVLHALLRHPPGMEMDALVRDVADRVEVRETMDLAAEVERALMELTELRLAACRSA